MSLGNRLTRLMASMTGRGGVIPQAQRIGVLDAPAVPVPWLSPGGFLNPNLDTGTDQAGHWLELHDALKDPKAAACLDLRCQTVSSLPWTLVPRPGTTPQALALVRSALEDLNLAEDFEELAKAAYFGLVPVEVHWQVKGGHLVPRELESFDPYYLSFGADRTPLVNGQAWAVGKLILHRHSSQFRNPWGLGRGRTVPRWVRVKTAIAYATYRDFPRYSHDRLKFTYPSDASDADQARFIAIAQKLIDSAGIVVPEGMDAAGVRLESKFEVGAKLIDAANGEIAVGILGNTLTTGEGRHGTNALGSVHQEQTERQEVADASRIEATLNRTLIPWIVALNLGADAVPPTFRFEREVRANMKERLDAALGLRSAGLEISKTWLRQAFSIPAPTDASDELEPVSTTQDTVPSLPNPVGEDPAPEPEPEPEPDSVELTAQDQSPVVAVLDRWMDTTAARQANMVRLVFQVVSEASDYPLEQLLGISRDFPTSAGEHLAAAMIAARDMGAFEVGQEMAALNLEAPTIDWGITPEGAMRWLQGKVPMAVKTADGIKDSQLRARAFWVAGVEQINLLQDLQRGMAEGLATGTPWPEFRDTWLPRLAGTDITAKRLKLAYDTQLHGAYMGGRMVALQADDRVDNLTYVTAGDESVRPNHRAVHGVTRPKDDIFWQTHTPPCGFRCRCRLRASEADRPMTPNGDSRLTVPPDNGFGEGAPAFARFLESEASTQSTWSPVSPNGPAFGWLESTRPRTAIPRPRPVTSPSAGLVADATGRVTYSPTPDAALAVQGAQEIWVAPVQSPEGELALQIAWITPDGVATAVGGVVPETGFQPIDPTPYRIGTRLL